MRNLNHIKLFEQYKNEYHFEDGYDVDMIKSMLLSCDSDNIELVYTMNSDSENEVDRLVDDLFNVTWFSKPLNLDGNTIKEKLLDLVSIKEIEINDEVDREDYSSMPNSIYNLINLEHLRLHIGGLETIPNEITNLVNLIELDLSYNELISFDSIFQLRGLKALSLNSIGLEEFPIEIFNLVNLEVLNLSYNNIKVIPNEITKLSKLRNLALDNNEIEIVPNSLTKLKNLKSLELVSNDFNDDNTFRTLQKLADNSVEVYTDYYGDYENEDFYGDDPF